MRLSRWVRESASLRRRWCEVAAAPTDVCPWLEIGLAGYAPAVVTVVAVEVVAACWRSTVHEIEEPVKMVVCEMVQL